MKIPTISLTQKPHYKKVAEDVDFYALFQAIEQKYETCFLLESLGEQSSESRYSSIGFDPSSFISSNTIKSKNPYLALQDMMPTTILSRQYAGGLVGYLSYESMNYMEPAINLTKHLDFETFLFGVYTDGLVYDKVTDELFYFYYDTNRYQEVKSLIGSPIPKQKCKVTFNGYSLTKRRHADIVTSVKKDIVDGRIFQAVVGMKAHYDISGNPISIYSKLRKVNPSPYMFYLKFGEKKMMGASPELLFRMRNGLMESFPLAGTVGRGSSDVEDRKLARLLMSDSKERAEHQMLVDLHRNDMGRVARFNTVRVNRLMDIKSFSHVQHMSSEITGMIRPEETMFSALASNFPAGTLTGAPKIEAMKVIFHEEKEPRGPYGGAVGQFGFNGDCTFTIPIRSLFISRSKAFAQAGSGIVADSVAEKEYKEVKKKLKAMEEALNLSMSS
ncbi:MAG: chorismate-binding protein [bacterium]|nr:chorismate-binding protein [bacterium]